MLILFSCKLTKRNKVFEMLSTSSFVDYYTIKVDFSAAISVKVVQNFINFCISEWFTQFPQDVCKLISRKSSTIILSTPKKIKLHASHILT